MHRNSVRQALFKAATPLAIATLLAACGGSDDADTEAPSQSAVVAVSASSTEGVDASLARYDFDEARRLAAIESDNTELLLKISGSEASFWARKGSYDRALDVARESFSIDAGQSYAVKQESARIANRVFGEIVRGCVSQGKSDSAMRYLVVVGSMLEDPKDFNSSVEVLATALAGKGEFASARKVARLARAVSEWRPDLRRWADSDNGPRENLLLRIAEMEEVDAELRGDRRASSRAKQEQQRITAAIEKKDEKMAKARAAEEEREAIKKEQDAKAEYEKKGLLGKLFD